MNYKIFLLFCFCFLFFLRCVSATVRLNEIFIKPYQTIELYNIGSESANISGWYIDDAGGSTYFTIPQETIIAPYSCLVFSSDFNFNLSSPDIVRLLNSSFPPTTSSAIIIDSYSYNKAPDNGYSFGRNPDGDGNWDVSLSSIGKNNKDNTSCLPVPTQIPTPYPTSTPTNKPTPSPQIIPTPPNTIIQDYSGIIISEVYPYPHTGEQEWVELYNSNDYSVDLTEWYIDDAQNSGSAPKLFSLTLSPKEYKSIFFHSSLFNNMGDVVRLLNQEKIEKDSLEYNQTKQGYSLGKTQEIDSFCIQAPSPNSTNNPCIINPTLATNQASSHQFIIKSTNTSSFSSSTMYNTISSVSPSTYNYNVKQNQSILGIQTKSNNPIRKNTLKKKKNNEYTLFSLLSFQYALLTASSVFIKIKNAT